MTAMKLNQNMKANQNNVVKDTKMPTDLMETAEAYDNIQWDNYHEIPL